jgi:ribonuclease HI
MNVPEESDTGHRPPGCLQVYSDGAARGNPGPAGIGGQALGPDGELLMEIHEYLGETTNNVAEYSALIRILEAAAGLGYSCLEVHTDSELLANQVTGGFKVKSALLKPLAARVKGLFEAYREVQVEHIPRAKNNECDRLANMAIDQGLAGLLEPILDDEDDALF